MQQKYIYLIFTNTGTWLSKLIHLVSYIKYPHISISFDNRFTEMYSFGRINPNNPFSGGFVVENLHEGIFRKFSGCNCIIYRIRISEDQYSSLRGLISNFLREKDRYGYNFIGLFGILFNKPLKRKYRYFCSQFVSEMLINCNILKCDKIPELISTNELFMIENKEIIYEGFVNQYLPDVKRIPDVALQY